MLHALSDVRRFIYGSDYMKASYICSSTDMMANSEVILAGLLVTYTNSSIPDLLIGLVLLELL